jgi:hypothetical protein
MNCCHQGRVDSTAQTAPMESQIINELLSRVTRGFYSPDSPRGSYISDELLSQVTRGFDSPHSP